MEDEVNSARVMPGSKGRCCLSLGLKVVVLYPKMEESSGCVVPVVPCLVAGV